MRNYSARKCSVTFPLHITIMIKIKRNRETLISVAVYLQGGVGKSTLTFHIASQFAKTHPERYLEYQNIFSVHSKNEKCYRRILIVDMCPQANVSTALLGASGDPVSSRLETIRNNLVVEQSDEEEEAKYFKSM